MTRTRRTSTEGYSAKVKSPAERGPPRHVAPVKAAAAGASADNSIERIVAPAAIERALSIYRQLQEREWSVVVQARKILTQHIYAMIDQGENDEHRLTVRGLVHLKSVERDHAIRSASDSQNRNAMKQRPCSAPSQLPVAKAEHQG